MPGAISSRLRSKDIDRMILAWLEPHIGDEPISYLDRDAIEELRNLALDEGWAQSTVDPYMCLVRSILKACADDRRLLPKAPKVPMFNPQVAEPCWLSREEWYRRKAELPPHLQFAAEFAILTGLRMHAMLALIWERIDLQARRLWVPGTQQKTGRTHGIPISQEAVAVLKELRKLNPEGAHVFHWHGKPIDDCNGKSFQEALKRAKIEGVNWHTFASWAVQSGVTLGLGGWKSYSMVLRYSHLAPDHLAAAAAKISTKKAQRRMKNA